MTLDIGIHRSRQVGGFPEPQPFDWLAFDIETANESRGSICAVGVALVRDGQVVDAGSQLINPQCEFSPYNSAVHGLDADAVRAAPTFGDFWPRLHDMVSGRTVVAHYASFDVGGLRKAVAQSDLVGPTFDLYCSWRFAKRVWPEMPSHSLGWVAPQLGIEFDHHEAGADAAACAAVVLAACAATGFASLPALAESIGCTPARLSPDSFRPVSILGAPSLRTLEGDLDAMPFS